MVPSIGPHTNAAKAPLERRRAKLVRVAELFEADEPVFAHPVVKCHYAWEHAYPQLFHQEQCPLHVRLNEQCPGMLPGEVLQVPVKDVAPPKIFVVKVHDASRLFDRGVQ